MASEKKYIARHLIPMTITPGKSGDKSKGIAPVKPVVKEINPGERVMLDPDHVDTKFFLESGAIVLADKDDDKAPTGKTAAPAKKTAAPAKKTATKRQGDDADKTAAEKGDDEGGKDVELV